MGVFQVKLTVCKQRGDRYEQAGPCETETKYKCSFTVDALVIVRTGCDQLLSHPFTISVISQTPRVELTFVSYPVTKSVISRTNLTN